MQILISLFRILLDASLELSMFLTASPTTLKKNLLSHEGANRLSWATHKESGGDDGRPNGFISEPVYQLK